MPDPTPSHQPSHLSELDGLRGLAAFTVMSCHALSLTPGLRFMAINPFMRGHEAVLLFFVLSGFVLALPYQAGRRTAFAAFVVRRVCRLYVPYLVALGAALVACLTVPHGGPQPVGWLSRVWHEPLDAWLVTSHLALVSPMHTDALIPVVWSLIHEMRISLVFPLVLLASRAPWWTLPIAGPALTWIAFSSGAQVGPSSDWGLNLLGTLYFLGFFLGGAMLARHRETLVAAVAAWPRAGRAALGALSLAFYWYTAIVLARLGVPAWVGEWLIGAAAGAGMVVTMASPTARAVLSLSPLRHLGRLSYGLYLVHSSVFLALLYLGAGHAPAWALLTVGVAIAFLAAEGLNRWVERPAIAWGRRVAAGLERGRPAVTPQADAASG